MDFTGTKIDSRLIKALAAEGITNPTKVQSEVIDPIIENKDMIVQSETGSGKTLAYLLPVFEKYKEPAATNQVIILVPTHELAMQIFKQAERLTRNSGIGIQAAVIMGDVNIKRQIEKLKEKPQIVIGTAGRILELIKKKKIAAHTVKTIIVDEADRLLDKDNAVSVQEVIKCTMRDRQLLFFSASMTKSAVEAARGLAKDAELVKTTETEKIPEHIEHMYFVTERRDKIEVFRKIARIIKAKKAMVFINKVSDIEEATAKLVYQNIPAECLHGSNLKKDRKRVVEAFRNNKIKFLIATDIAARGLHFEGVDTVFHISIPQEGAAYLHRAGRTGRNGEAGRNILIITKEEIPIVKRLEKSLSIKIKPMEMYQGKIFEKKKSYK